MTARPQPAGQQLARPQPARPQLARLLPLALLIVLAIAGLRGAVAAPEWNGPLKTDGIAIGLAMEVVFGVLLLITLRRDRLIRRTRENTPVSATVGDMSTDVPAALRFVLRYVLAAGMLVVAAVLLTSLHLHFFASSHPPTLPRRLLPTKLPTLRTGPSGGGSHLPIATILYGLLVAVLVAAIALSIIWSSRLRRAAAPAVIADDLAEDSAGLRDAVESGRAALAELDDARAAIIACYVAMERSLAERGTARNAADTPDELLSRAIGTGLVRGPAARELTRLFYEARFSSHPLGPGERDAARQALDDLATELAGLVS
jgi:hypothetical protein